MLTKKDNNIKIDQKNGKNTKDSTIPENTEVHRNGCCQPSQPLNLSSSKTFSQPSPVSKLQQPSGSRDQKATGKSHITVKYNAGFSNQLFIRGKGANLSWEKGQPLRNTKPDEWIWETDSNFTSCEFKILINDQIYETGENHTLNAGSTLLYSPNFQ